LFPDGSGLGFTSKAKLFLIKNFLKKNFLKSLTNFNLTPFGPQNRRILCLCQTEIPGQVLNFTKGVQKHRTRTLKKSRLRRIWPPAAPAAGRNPIFFSPAAGGTTKKRGVLAPRMIHGAWGVSAPCVRHALRATQVGPTSHSDSLPCGCQPIPPVATTPKTPDRVEGPTAARRTGDRYPPPPAAESEGSFG